METDNNVFKQLAIFEQDIKAPGELKERVFHSYHLLAQSFRVVELFTGNFFYQIAAFIQLIEQSETKRKTTQSSEEA